MFGDERGVVQAGLQEEGEENEETKKKILAEQAAEENKNKEAADTPAR